MSGLISFAGDAPSEIGARKHLMHMIFFFQAEDGIRYWSVTGVQTCALPIWKHQNGSGVVSRPSSITERKYEDVARAYIRAVHSVLTGKTRAPEAAAGLEKELVGITGFKTGPPSQIRGPRKKSAEQIR